MRRLAVLTVLTWIFVGLFAGTAMADDKVLDQTVCEDGSAWTNGSQIVNGTWDSGPDVCEADSFLINAGDSLTVPSGVILATGGTTTVNGGVLANSGLVSTDTLAVDNGGAVTNSGSAVGNLTTLVSGGTFDNFAAFGFTELRINVGGIGGAVFTNHCGAEMSVTTFVGDPPVQGSCTTTTSSTTTVPAPSTTVSAPTTTIAGPTTTVIDPTTTAAGPTTTIAVAVTGEELPFTGVESGTSALWALTLVASGLLVLAASSARSRERRD